MSLAYYARNAASAERARRRMRRDGCNMNGDKLWTEAENEIIRKCGPDFDKIHKRLPHRTRKAIEFQCRKLGLRQKSLHIWSAAEISKLRRLYPSATKEEICTAFPHSTLVNIRQVARYHGFRRARKPFKPTGVHQIDEMLDRAFKANMRLRELDLESGTKNYFQKENWRYKRINYNRLARALEVLDGEFKVQWRDV